MNRELDDETITKMIDKAFAQVHWVPFNATLPAAPIDQQPEQPVDPLSAERQSRLDAVNQARAILGLDGFVWDDAMEGLNRRFIDADLDLDQYIDAVKALVASEPSADRHTIEARFTGMRIVAIQFRPV